jgi:hypothetical protein
MYRSFMATNFADTDCKIATGSFLRRCLTNSLDAVARIRRHDQQKRHLLLRNDPREPDNSDSWAVVNPAAVMLSTLGAFSPSEVSPIAACKDCR